jgi:hypothetical protein
VGVKNARLVYAKWGHLPDEPFRLLVFMALTSLDRDEAPRFWGGRETLAVGLGRLGRERDPATIRSVRRNVAELVRFGAITRAGHAHRGRNATYRLNL